jgi:peptidoglycan-N-acetylglucosamine deacetylase
MRNKLSGDPLIRSLVGVAAGLAVVQAGPGITGLAPVRSAFFPGLAGIGMSDHVALTFDDGPDLEATPPVLSMLRERGVRATFFLIGSRVAMMPKLAAEIADAGHEVAVHGWDHGYLLLRGPVSTYDHLARAVDVITSATGVVPWLFRPPYGVLSTPAIVAARRLGLRPVLWSCWGREWTRYSTPLSVFETLKQDLRGGATVLLHDSDYTARAGSAEAALGALPLLLDECAKQELIVGPLGEHAALYASRV